MKLSEVSKRLKRVRARDVLSAFPMAAGLVASVPLRLTHGHIWLFCERADEARDNGYWLFKYVRENHPEIEAVYAIKKRSVDYRKVAALGKVIEFGSVDHWRHYFAAEKNLSSQKEGKPNAALCFVLEVFLGLRKNRYYLKHGVTKDKQRFIYYDLAKMTMMSMTSAREQAFVQQHFGYPPDAIKLLGMCRFDNLLSPHEVKRTVLVMPTRREWLDKLPKKASGEAPDICDSTWCKAWNGVLHNQRLGWMLEEHDVNLVFYLHPNMFRFASCFSSDNPRITVVEDKAADLQQLLMESAVLVTDYSSVFFDFAYMGKPVVYYQFDYDEYRAKQYEEGYFTYPEDGFGPVAYVEDALMDRLDEVIRSGFAVEDEYARRSDEFFAFHDDKNCERTFDAVSSYPPGRVQSGR